MYDILVSSSDNYEDCWELFFKLKDKYWSCSNDTYLLTETKKCQYAETINVNEPCWTKRLREALKLLKNDYVILMLEDFFIRDLVNQERIQYCLEHFDKDTAVFNFELKYRDAIPCDLQGFELQKNNQMYLCSCMPSLWDREKLIWLLREDMTPWEWEMQNLNSGYKFYINSEDIIIDIGYYKGNIFAIRQGHWVKEDMENLLKKENFYIDLTKRGVI